MRFELCSRSREQDNVARLELEAEGDDVDAMAGVEGEDDLFFGGGVDEVLDDRPRAFDALFLVAVDPVGDLPGEAVAAAAGTAGRVLGVVLGDGLDHRTRRERVAGVVEIDRRAAVL